MNSDEPQHTGIALAAAAGAPAENLAGLSACWSDSGVYGDGSCLELQRFVHCRNCPVYSAAGVRLLDQPLPPKYREEWTRHFAQERRLPDAGNASAVLFRIQNDWFALATQSFQEVAEKRPIHSLPHRREGIVLGLANVRGELVICISVGHLLQVDPMPPVSTLRLNYHRLLVIQSPTSRLAFPVDEVHGPHRFHPQELKSRLPSPARATPHFVQGVLQWRERSAGVLDTDQLFTSLQRTLG